MPPPCRRPAIAHRPRPSSPSSRPCRPPCPSSAACRPSRLFRLSLCPPWLPFPLRFRLSASERFARARRDPIHASVRAALDAHARAAVRLGVEEQHVRQVDRSFLLQDAALLALPARTGVTL